MPCPTCSHTMQCLSVVETRATGYAERLFWCERCGTLVRESGDGEAGFSTSEQPKLVERCRDYNDRANPMDNRLWRALGIMEAIYPPPRT